MSGVSKVVAEKNHRIILELVAQPGNDTCADCHSRAPRWASHNLGIFICVRCATVHRKIGTHVTKVKSLTLDSWSKEQVEHMKTIGNLRANARWNPDERRNPPPTNMEESERDSELEKYIRAKYEAKRFMAPTSPSADDEDSQRTPQASHFASSSRHNHHHHHHHQAIPARSHTAPLRESHTPTSSSLSHPVPTPSGGLSASYNHTTAPPARSATAALPQPQSHLPPVIPPARTTSQQPYPQQQQLAQQPKGAVWDDLISLQGPSTNSSLPLQFQSPSSSTSTYNTNTPNFSQSPSSAYTSSPPFASPTSMSTNPYATLSASPGSFAPGLASSPGLGARSASLPIPFGTSTSPFGVGSQGTGIGIGMGMTTGMGMNMGMGVSPMATGMSAGGGMGMGSLGNPFSPPFGMQNQQSQTQPTQIQNFAQPQPQGPSPYGQPQQTYGTTPSPFQQQPAQQQFNTTPSPAFGTQPSPFQQQQAPFGQQQHSPFQTQMQLQQQQQQQPQFASNPLSTQAQQAQALFANMQGNNPFGGGGGWGA